ncbi:MAG: S-layer homology domain-containing protein, partial [Clostridia bacterium]|nr:S-layer homology domain-containing protein [Clostridia bacterium]
GAQVIANDTAKVSCGLDVIAEQNQMALAGIKGNPIGFSADKFACAMNLSRVEKITVTSLPDMSCGNLFIGSEGVSEGQTISSANISLMTYEEAPGGIGRPASFSFTVNGSAYEMTCNLYMIDSVNYSPTVTSAPVVSLNNYTYKNISVSGVLSAFDPEGDDLTFEIVRYPSHGILTLEDKTLGTYVYEPIDSYTGEDSFEYVVRDKYGNYSSSEKVRVKVNSQKTSTVYSDLLGDELYSHAIAVTESGLMNGTRVGDYFYFEADREVSRAEFVVTAMNAIGIKNVPNTQSTGFSDDSEINPAMKGYIALAYSKGYISGINDNGKICFKPDESITLSEASVIISNMVGYAKPTVAPVFYDTNEIPTWSSAAIESLYTLGVLEFPDKTVNASAYMTRGDMAKLLNKTMQLIGK